MTDTSLSWGHGIGMCYVCSRLKATYKMTVPGQALSFAMCQIHANWHTKHNGWIKKPLEFAPDVEGEYFDA